MRVASKVFSLSSLTVAAAVESFLVNKFYAASFPGVLNLNIHFEIAVILVLANFGFWLLFWCFIYPRFISPLRHLAGPRSLVSALWRTLLVRDRPSGDLFLDIKNKYPGHDMLSLTAFDSHVMVLNPQFLADLLVHKSYDFVKPAGVRGLLRHVLGDGLVIVEGDQHKFMRKNSQPAFSFRHIKNLYLMMWQKSVLMTQMLQEALVSGEGKDTGAVDLNNWSSKVTLDIIGVAGMGTEFNMLKKAEDPLLASYETLLNPAPEMLLYALCSIVFGMSFVNLLPWHMNRLFKESTDNLSRICMSMVEDKRRAIATTKDDHFDLLSLLIKSDYFDNSQLTHQLLTFLAAGHETTSSSFTWSCYLLAKHPEMQERLREEIRQALPDDKEIDQSTDLAGIFEQLPYLNGVIHETLRLYPTVPLTIREAIRDTEIGGQMIPKGVAVIMSMWQIQRSPDLWGAEPCEFRPERWITADKPNLNGGASSNYNFLTFLHGPRSCIGQGFARGELRCLLASMVRTFSWDLCMDDAKVLPRGVITIKPEKGLFLSLHPLRK
ncbi:cytochrome P450 [Xylaria nigripes]|nr:cytochrome P450 [Xylaria nigripes]